jgi:hypothetical protein
MKNFTKVAAVVSALTLASAGFAASKTKKVASACTIVGDSTAKVFHKQGDADYAKLVKEAHQPGMKAQCFATAAEAEAAGYKPAAQSNK